MARPRSITTRYTPGGSRVLDVIPRMSGLPSGQSSSSGGGSSTPLIAKAATTVAGLGVGSYDGQPGILRIGTWPNLHEELLKWNSGLNKWVGDSFNVLTQSDTWAMDLGNRSGAQLVDWSLVTNPIPYSRHYTSLNGAQAANSATINANARYANAGDFAASGTILIRDNIINYTGISGTQSAPFSFTGCTLASGSGGTIPTGVDIVQGFPGGYGIQAVAVQYATELWSAGLRLQEKLLSFMNGSPEAGGGKALAIAPYWYEYSSGDAQIPPALPLTGGIGLSASLTGTTAPNGNKAAERQFTWAENPWSDWAAGTPTKRYLYARLAGKMASASTDTGECLDTTLRMRWISA